MITEVRRILSGSIGDVGTKIGQTPTGNSTFLVVPGNIIDHLIVGGGGGGCSGGDYGGGLLVGAGNLPTGDRVVVRMT